MKKIILECCVDSVQSAVNARNGEADRLELCSALALGGLSPTVSLFSLVKKSCDLPINVLLRPREGDFLYSDYELAQLLDEVKTFKSLGANGVVIGCLNTDGSLDMDNMRKLISAADGMDITLHRAFDVSRDPLDTLKKAQELGVKTILTSGCAKNCTLGKALIQTLCENSNGVEIMAGSGVNADVIADFAKTTDVRAFHMSGKQRVKSKMKYIAQNVSMGDEGVDEYSIWQTSEAEVKRASNVLLFL
ncbi:MAG: copper homeostasis protein CutC [Clostridia bacterium]|jgi:copper homeostasis protein|nr:copper homeostasis protein CutC [Clostridia bacterium]